MTAELFVELSCEELPAAMVRPALAALEKGLLGLLDGIEHGAVSCYATPRRLAVAIADVAAQRPRVERVITGPPAAVALRDGVPTKAAIGFARGRGFDASALTVVDGPKGKVVALVVEEGGERVASLVGSGLDAIIRGLPFSKSMEWGTGGVRWARPLRSVAAIYDTEVVQGQAAGLPIGDTTLGHRLATDTEFAFRNSGEWLVGLHGRRVEPDIEIRKEKISDLLGQAVVELGCDPIDAPELLEEVTHLVEWPVLVIGSFDEELLVLPPRLLVETMTVHQRYFPVYRDGKLTHHFVVISNNPWGDAALVATGNARVLRARFYDARFFFLEDRKRSLSEHGAALERMRWIRGLSTVAAKQTRVAALAGVLADRLGLGSVPMAARAGELSKSDLATQMVGEFPKLQGHIGHIYALADGESEEVAVGIEEHYLPRFAGDQLAQTPAGAAVALADRLDTLAGCFGIGLVPKGGDPQGLRRAALGVVLTLVAHRVRVDLGELCALALRHFDAAAQAAPEDYPAWAKARKEATLDAALELLTDFCVARLKASEVTRGASADLVDAVLALEQLDPLLVNRRVEALRSVSGTADFLPIMHTFKRVLNITRGVDAQPPADADFTEDAERALAEAVRAAREAARLPLEGHDYASALRVMLALREPVARFFDDVLVEADDPVVKAVRKGLLREVSDLFLQVADFSRISTR